MSHRKTIDGFVVCLLFCLACVTGFSGCASAPGGGGGEGGENTPPPVDEELGDLQTSFDAGGGNLAVAEDGEGNQYSFRAVGSGDDEIITEANIRLLDGRTIKASLDSEGRPVKFRSSEGEHADVFYDGNDANVRLAESSTTVGPLVSGLNTKAAIARGKANQVAQRSKIEARLQNGGTGSTQVERLKRGFMVFEETVDTLFDPNENPGSPLIGTDFEEPVRRLAGIARGFNVVDVERNVIQEVEIDEVPLEIAQLANQTFILFDAEGFCLDLIANIENELTFTEDGTLQQERDRNFIFPNFSVYLGQTDRGTTINYTGFTTFPLVPVDQDLGFTADITPVFTGTQLDRSGNITIERRFLALVTEEAEDFLGFEGGVSTREYLFNAAFVNGQLNEDGSILSLDLVLVDLQRDSEPQRFGTVRYFRQGFTEPSREFVCNEQVGASGATSGLTCPVNATAGVSFDVSFVTRNPDRILDFDWFVSDGFGFMNDPFSQNTSVFPTADGPLEISLIVSDLSVEPQVFDYYTCEVLVGQSSGNSGALQCPAVMTAGQPGFFNVDSPDSFAEWFIFGTFAFDVTDPFGFGTDITFYEAGRFDVQSVTFDDAGNRTTAQCQVNVQPGDGTFDECELQGYYGDGICDDFCPRFDPDCDDICALNGWYGDGECDTFCPLFDELDCDGDSGFGGFEGDFCEEDDDCALGFICDNFGCTDECALFEFYGDYQCDDFCPEFDQDCDDPCVINDFYFDDVCDDDCPRGICCFLADPDCDQEGFDCFSDFDCDFDEECVGGICVPSSNEFECFDDIDCDFDEQCIDGFCETAQFVECQGDCECEVDEQCVGGECLFHGPFDCFDDTSCCPDEFCLGGFCVDGGA